MKKCQTCGLVMETPHITSADCIRALKAELAKEMKR